MKKKAQYFFKNKALVIVDIYNFFIKQIHFKNKKEKLIDVKVSNKVNQANYNFYFEYKPFTSTFNTNQFNKAWKYIWFGIRYWVLPLVISCAVFYYLSFLKLLPFNKVLFGWLSVFMLVYWLVSGFVFFIKKYQFGKYTSVIQRFWRRSYILFWILEACLFFVFFYLTLNASSESFFMLDQPQYFKNYLFSWRFFLLKIIPLSLLIISVYIYTLSVKFNTMVKNSLVLLAVTLVLTYVVWLEFYQFHHLLHFYGNLVWNYEHEEKTWSLDLEIRRVRIKNNYVSILMLLKFWHIVFIYGFWLFFLLRVKEIKRVRYPLLSANLQNFIILYIFGWVFMYPWFKFFFKKFFENPYYWFYINNHYYFLRVFFNDLKLIFFQLMGLEYIKINFFFKNFSFFYWNSSNSDFGFYNSRKHFIKNTILCDI